MLTETGEMTVDRVVTWFLFGSYVFVAYALAQHLGWTDAIAATIAFLLTLRAIGPRRTS